MVKWRDSTERWSKPLYVCWLSNLYLKLNGVACCVMLSLQSTQQFLRALGTHHLSLFMGNRLGYLLMLLLGVRVGGLMLLTWYRTSRILSRMPRIIPREPKSIRSATLTSTTDYKSIMWEKKCCSLQRHCTWQVLRSFGLGLLDLSGCWSMWERLHTGWISGEDSKIFTMFSTFPSFASTPLKAHLQTHPSQSK